MSITSLNQLMEAGNGFVNLAFDALYPSATFADAEAMAYLDDAAMALEPHPTHPGAEALRTFIVRHRHSEWFSVPCDDDEHHEEVWGAIDTVRTWIINWARANPVAPLTPTTVRVIATEFANSNLSWSFKAFQRMTPPQDRSPDYGSNHTLSDRELDEQTWAMWTETLRLVAPLLPVLTELEFQVVGDALVVGDLFGGDDDTHDRGVAVVGHACLRAELGGSVAELGDALAPAPLTPNHLVVLRHLCGLPCAVDQMDIAVAVELSRATVGSALKDLRERGLAEYAQKGKKSVPTAKGRQLVRTDLAQIARRLRADDPATRHDAQREDAAREPLAACPPPARPRALAARRN